MAPASPPVPQRTPARTSNKDEARPEQTNKGNTPSVEELKGLRASGASTHGATVPVRPRPATQHQTDVEDPHAIRRTPRSAAGRRGDGKGPMHARRLVPPEPNDHPFSLPGTCATAHDAWWGIATRYDPGKLPRRACAARPGDLDQKTSPEPEPRRSSRGTACRDRSRGPSAASGGLCAAARTQARAATSRAKATMMTATRT